MKYDDLVLQLQSTTSRTFFDSWISVNIEEITSFFYELSDDDLLNMNFDTEFYFGVFTQSPVFKEFERSRNYSEPFDAFLFILGSVNERLAEKFGKIAPLEHLLVYLPESSVKYRLIALSESQNIDNIKTDYIKLFPKVLELMSKADSIEVESHIQKIINFLVYYFQKAETKLLERKYLSELEQLKNEFTNARKIEQYSFLGHFTVQELVAGRYPHELKIDDSKLEILYPSTIVERHFKYNVNLPVLSHPLSSGFDKLLGYDKSTILNNVLERGKTTFDEKYGNLTPDDKVLLYCYFNMKKHFFTSIAVYKRVWTSISEILFNKKYVPVFIDLGCGPLTSGLALADLYYTDTNESLLMHYIGIDISEAMIKKAKEFSDSELFNQNSSFTFYKNWNDIDQKLLKEVAGSNNPFFINASYLFANLTSSLADDLARFVKKLVFDYKNVHFIFQNPNRIDRNTHWEKFKLQLNLKRCTNNVEKVIYKTNRFREPGAEDVYYEILTLNP